MKRRIALLVAIGMMLLCVLTTLSGCGPPGYSAEHMRDPESLDAIVVLQMRESFQKQFMAFPLNLEYGIKDIYIQRHFSEFEKHVVVYMGSPLIHNAAMRYEEIDGLEFEFPSSQKVYVYHDRRFNTLREAFDAELLTYEDLLELQEVINPK